MIKLSELLHEGFRDPGIFKAVFLAGGPGSGKTYIAKGLFGIPEKVNVSQSGLKMVNSDKELKFLLNKYGFGTNLDALPDEVFSNLTNPNDPQYSGLRDFAKDLTGQRRKLYQDGRLGMIIDGTGDDFQKISREKKELEDIGYDTYMIFVSTTLEVALDRNEKRDRVLPKSIVQASHKEVNRNIGAFQGLFGGSNFMIVDNNQYKSESEAKKRFKMLVKQGLSTFLKKPITSEKAKSWIRKQKLLDKSKGRAK
jgi:predicted kinase